MNVAICCLSAKYIHASLAPWCLKSGVDLLCNNSINTKVFEFTINGNINEFINNICSYSPDIISFTCYIWNITKTLDVCQKLKDLTNATIILGGPEVSYRAKDILNNNSYIDYVLSGEGEETYPELLNKLKCKESISTVAGLNYRNGEKVISVPEKEYTSTPPSPYTNDFYNNLKGRIAYIETSRGCPYRCAFCLSGRCSKLRFFDIEQVKCDIINLANSGTQTLKFVDRTFNANEKRANEIIKFILDNRGVNIPENICFHFEIAGDILKESTIQLLKSAPVGLFQLEIGMQSFNEDTLKAINRKTNTSILKKNIKRLVEFNNMHIHIDLIAGLTGEDFDSFKESFNTGYSLKAHMLQMGFLKLLYGSDMRESPDKYPCKFTTDPPYEVTETPWLSENELHSLKLCEDALDRLYNSGRFIKSLDYLITECGFEPFDVFYKFGNMINGCKMTLSQYAEHFYTFFKDNVNVNCDLFREYILWDMLCCSSSLQIPDSIKIKEPLYRQAKRKFTEGTSDKIKVAVLPHMGKILVVNQSTKKDLHGRYPFELYKIDIINAPEE